MVHTHNPALVRSKQKNQKFKALPSSFLVSSRMSRIQRPCLNGVCGGDRQTEKLNLEHQNTFHSLLKGKQRHIKNLNNSQAWWYMPVIIKCKSQWQVDL